MIRFFIYKKVPLLIFVSAFFVPVLSEAQSNQRVQKQFDKALGYYKAQEYKQAIEVLDKVIGKAPRFQDAYLLLSDIYGETNNTEMEIANLLEAQEISQKPLICYHLAEAFFSIGEYEKALLGYNSYLNDGEMAEGRREGILRKIGNCRFAITAKNNPVDFAPERLSNNINSICDEYWPVISLDQTKLVFTRLITYPGRFPQEDFYFSVSGTDGWGEAKPILEINTGQNEGAETLSSDGKLLFFTACNRPDGRGSCDIYFSRFVDGKWTKAKNAGGVNTGGWESQPSFSSDNRFLYFSSNRSGGKGKKDIWRIQMKGFGSQGGIVWGEPQNLGDSINTPGDEISPFIHPNNRDFYFVSDYHTGMGGYDLFTSRLSAGSVFSRPVNLGYPINTQNDEQGLDISADGQTAYFASARDNTTGLDIYSFVLDESIRPTPVTYVRANVIDAKTKQSLHATINLIDLAQPENERTEETDNSGGLLACLPLGANYAFNVLKEGYLFYSRSFFLEEAQTLCEPYVFIIGLQPIEPGAEMDLYNIYFETDSFSILPASEPELKRLLVFLNNNPSLSIEIQGHTDDTGNKGKNQALSELRAKSVAAYLVEKGIKEGRLSYKGFGQCRPVASNGTEEGRRLNRRTTIKILGN